MTNQITEERWKQAQQGELYHYQYQYNNEETYERSALIILQDHFKVNVKTNLIGKKILESGGGCYPASYFCEGLNKAVNIEPLCDQFPEEIKSKLLSKNIECVSTSFEEYKTRIKFDEVWFFNVLQHVKDPVLQIENAKKIAKIIRVFEPLDTAINNEHPHSFNFDFFVHNFPDVEVEKYNGGSISGFHQASCAYLTWIKK